MTDARDPLEKLRDAVQEFANATNDHPHIVTAAVVCWEEAMNDGEETLWRFRYADVSHGPAAATLGLTVAARQLVEHDLFCPHDHEEDE